MTDRRKSTAVLDPEHTCHATGCNEVVPPAMFMCRRHWYMLTPPMRHEIWATYRKGQEVTKTPSREYLIVARKCIAYVERLEKERDRRKRN